MKRIEFPIDLCSDERVGNADTDIPRSSAKDTIMRDFRDAKLMARSLRQNLSGYGLSITNSQSLELTAQAFGYDNWNILAAKIEAERPVLEPAKDDAKDTPTLHCSFCGKPQQAVRKLIAGPEVAICNDCVDLCNDVIEHEDVLALLAADERSGAPEYPQLAAWFDTKTAEQIRVYLDAAGKGLEATRSAIRSTDVVMAARSAGTSAEDSRGPHWSKFLAAKSDNQLTKHRALLETRLMQSEKAVVVVTALLRERGQRSG